MGEAQHAAEGDDKTYLHSSGKRTRIHEDAERQEFSPCGAKGEEPRPAKFARLDNSNSGDDGLGKAAEETEARAAEEAGAKEGKEARLMEVEEARTREAEEVRKQKATAAAAARAAEEARLTKAEEVRARKAEAAVVAAAVAAAAAAAQNRAKSGPKERVPLTSQQQQQVLAAWKADGDGDAVAVNAFNETVLKRSLMTLQEGSWVNDEVVNLYAKILLKRNRDAIASGRSVPKCGIVSSFFFTAISDYGKGYRYAGVKRLLKKAKIDLFALDEFIVPVNVGKNHWAVGVINFRRERLEYYDSLPGRQFEKLHGFEYMVRFVHDESKAKRGLGMDIAQWPRVNVAERPMQQNGVDCGVFACMFAYCLTKGMPLNFSQSDIKHYRRVMTLAILRGEGSPSEEEKLLEGWPD